MRINELSMKPAAVYARKRRASLTPEQLASLNEKHRMRLRAYTVQMRDDPEYRARMAAKAKLWRDKNPESAKDVKDRFKMKLKRRTMEAYGGASCRCCGEDEIEFLTLDHIEPIRSQKREHGYGSHFYLWLQQNGYPEGLQVLCYNCNRGKSIYKECPHKRIFMNKLRYFSRPDPTGRGEEVKVNA